MNTNEIIKPALQFFAPLASTLQTLLSIKPMNRYDNGWLTVKPNNIKVCKRCSYFEVCMHEQLLMKKLKTSTQTQIWLRITMNFCRWLLSYLSFYFYMRQNNKSKWNSHFFINNKWLCALNGVITSFIYSVTVLCAGYYQNGDYEYEDI